jgi:hypothetical protein
MYFYYLFFLYLNNVISLFYLLGNITVDKSTIIERREPVENWMDICSRNDRTVTMYE